MIKMGKAVTLWPCVSVYDGSCVSALCSGDVGWVAGLGPVQELGRTVVGLAMSMWHCRWNQTVARMFVIVHCMFLLRGSSSDSHSNTRLCRVELVFGK